MFISFGVIVIIVIIVLAVLCLRRHVTSSPAPWPARTGTGHGPREPVPVLREATP
jgi:hypothetical protein